MPFPLTTIICVIALLHTMYECNNVFRSPKYFTNELRVCELYRIHHLWWICYGVRPFQILHPAQFRSANKICNSKFADKVGFYRTGGAVMNWSSTGWRTNTSKCWAAIGQTIEHYRSYIIMNNDNGRVDYSVL